MNSLRLAVTLAVVFGLAGCGSDQDTAMVMPDVMGRTLDVALSDIERAGVEDEVEVVGGGTLGIIDESNWQVCEQLPAVGEAVTAAPRLTVDRSCDDGAPKSTTPSTTPEAATSDQPSEEPIQEPEESESGESPTEEILTVENSEDLAALLAEPDNCNATVEGFGAKYQGRIVEFDGNIAGMNNHGDYDTRYDFLIVAGDFSETSQVGPTFQFEDVGILDLNLNGSNVPESIGTGDNLHIVATVEEYTEGCLLLLDPVSTEVR